LEVARDPLVLDGAQQRIDPAGSEATEQVEGEDGGDRARQGEGQVARCAGEHEGDAEGSAAGQAGRQPCDQEAPGDGARPEDAAEDAQGDRAAGDLLGPHRGEHRRAGLVDEVGHQDHEADAEQEPVAQQEAVARPQRAQVGLAGIASLRADRLGDGRHDAGHDERRDPERGGVDEQDDQR
jgi:hypothetical protein